MESPTPKFPKTEEALKAYGENIYAQAKALGFPYTTLRDWILFGKVPQTLVRLACKQDIYTAFGEDVAAQSSVLCTDPSDLATDVASTN
jgi:hypothetical protein